MDVAPTRLTDDLQACAFPISNDILDEPVLEFSVCSGWLILRHWVTRTSSLASDTMLRTLFGPCRFQMMGLMVLKSCKERSPAYTTATPLQTVKENRILVTGHEHRARPTTYFRYMH